MDVFLNPPSLLQALIVLGGFAIVIGGFRATYNEWKRGDDK